MTVRMLHDVLAELMRSGNGRAQVVVFRDTFSNNFDGVTYHHISGMSYEPLVPCGDAGYAITQPEDNESAVRCAVLYGAIGQIKDARVEVAF